MVRIRHRRYRGRPAKPDNFSELGDWTLEAFMKVVPVTLHRIKHWEREEGVRLVRTCFVCQEKFKPSVQDTGDKLRKCHTCQHARPSDPITFQDVPSELQKQYMNFRFPHQVKGGLPNRLVQNA